METMIIIGIYDIKHGYKNIKHTISRFIIRYENILSHL